MYVCEVCMYVCIVCMYCMYVKYVCMYVCMYVKYVCMYVHEREHEYECKHEHEHEHEHTTNFVTIFPFSITIVTKFVVRTSKLSLVASIDTCVVCVEKEKEREKGEKRVRKRQATSVPVNDVYFMLIISIFFSFRVHQFPYFLPLLHRHRFFLYWMHIPSYAASLSLGFLGRVGFGIHYHYVLTTAIIECYLLQASGW